MRREHTIQSSAIFFIILPTFNTFSGFAGIFRVKTWWILFLLFSVCLAFDSFKACHLIRLPGFFWDEGVCAHCLHNLHLASIFNMLARKLVQFFSSFVVIVFFSSSPSALRQIALMNGEKKCHDYFINQFFTRTHHSRFHSSLDKQWDCLSC